MQHERTLRDIDQEGRELLDDLYWSDFSRETQFKIFVVEALLGIIRHMAVR